MTATASRSSQQSDAPATSTGGQPATAPPRLLGLDGLRGIAILSVLFYHDGFHWAIGSFLAVSLFFTLSGYLITTLLIREATRSGHIDLVRFWGRRLRRIVPAALLALLFVALFGAIAASPTQQAPLRGDIWAALANVTNWRLLFGGRSYADLFADPSPLQHFWSLAIEEQFYLFYPLIVAGCAWYVARVSAPERRATSLRISLAVVTGVLGLASIAAQVGYGGRDHIYYGTDSRAWEILAGVLLACALTGKPLRNWVKVAGAVAGLVAFVVMLWAWSQVAFGSHWLYIGGFAAFALIDVLVVFGATLAGPLRWFCSFRPLVWIGLISYGLYLFHWPVYVWLDEPRTGLTGWSLFALRVLVTGVLAVASFYLVEKPIREGRFPKSWRAPVAWIAGVAVVAVAAWMLVPVPANRDIITASDFTRADQLVRAAGTSKSAATKGAAIAGVPSPLDVYLVGDSTAALFGGGLALYQKDTGAVTVRSSAIATCALLQQDDVFWADGTQGTPKAECRTRPEQWRTDLAAKKPDAILVIDGAFNTSTFRRADVAGGKWTSIAEPAGEQAVREGIAATIAALRTDAPHTPILLFTAPYTERRKYEVTPAGDSPSNRKRIDKYNALLEEAARANPGVVVVPWGSYFDKLSTDEFAAMVPDGFHADMPTVDDIVHRWGWTRITEAYLAARAEQSNR